MQVFKIPESIKKDSKYKIWKVIFMADIVYDFEGGLYLNITNDCPCDCVFCIREKTDSIGTGHSMWHDRQPTFDEIKAAVDSVDMSKYIALIIDTLAYDKSLSTVLSPSDRIKDLLASLK